MSEKEKLRKCFEIYTKQYELIRKLGKLNKSLEDTDIAILLKKNFPLIQEVYYGYDGRSFWFDIPVGEKMTLGDLGEIERLTGFLFERKPYDNRYSFELPIKDPNIKDELSKIHKIIYGDDK